MAEIKSTLDLVMERTKHLSFGEGEKEAQKTEDIQKIFKGMVQKYQDNVFTKEELRKALDRSKGTFDLKDNALFINEISGHIHLTRNNDLMFDLLVDLFGIKVTALESIIGKFNDTIRNEIRERGDKVKTELMGSHQISGSAVLPNLSTNPVWEKDLQGILEKFEQGFSREKARILES